MSQYVDSKYEETVRDLFRLLQAAAGADTHYAQAWQRPHDSAADADTYYSHLYRALCCIAGEELVLSGLRTGELDFRLATRR